MRRSIKTWQLAIELDSGQFMYAYKALPLHGQILRVLLQILKVVEIQKTDDVKRPYIKQLLTKKLRFPLPHRIAKSNSKKIFAAHRPSTFA